MNKLEKIYLGSTNINKAYLGSVLVLKSEGPELISNGDFSDTSVWTLEAGWSISGGSATYDAVGNSKQITQPVTIVSGNTYIFRVSISNVASGKVSRFRLDANGSPVFIDYNSTLLSNGDHELEFTASADSSIIRMNAVKSSNGGSYTMDNFSLKQKL